MWYVPAGFCSSLKKDTFLRENKHCAYVGRARRGFFFSSNDLSIICEVFSLFLMIFLEEGDDNNNDDTETTDPVQAHIPSHPGIKYLVRGIPPSDDGGCMHPAKSTLHFIHIASPISPTTRGHVRQGVATTAAGA